MAEKDVAIVSKSNIQPCRVCIALLCGLPGSGKTYLSGRICEGIDNDATYRQANTNIASSSSHMHCNQHMKGDIPLNDIWTVIHVCYDTILPHMKEEELIVQAKLNNEVSRL